MRFNARGDLTGIPGGQARPWGWPITAPAPFLLFPDEPERLGGYGQWLNDETIVLLEHAPRPGVLHVTGTVERIAEGPFNTLFAGAGNWLATAITDQQVRTIGLVHGRAHASALRILDMDLAGRFLALRPDGGDQTFIFDPEGRVVAGLPADAIFCRMSDGLVMLRRHHARKVEVYRADTGARVATVPLHAPEQWPGAAWHVGDRLWLWYEIPGDRSVIHAADDHTRGYLLDGPQHGKAARALSAMGALVAYATGEGEGVGFLRREFVHDIAAGATPFTFSPPPPPPPPQPPDPPEEPDMRLVDLYTNRADVAAEVNARWPQLLERARREGEAFRGAYVDQLAHRLNALDNETHAAAPGYVWSPWGRKYRVIGDPASANDDALTFRLHATDLGQKKLIDVVAGDAFEPGWDLRPASEEPGNGFWGPPIAPVLGDGDGNDVPADVRAELAAIRETVERIAVRGDGQDVALANLLRVLGERCDALEAAIAARPGAAVVFPVYSGTAKVLGFTTTITLTPQPPQA